MTSKKKVKENPLIPVCDMKNTKTKYRENKLKPRFKRDQTRYCELKKGHLTLLKGVNVAEFWHNAVKSPSEVG